MSLKELKNSKFEEIRELTRLIEKILEKCGDEKNSKQTGGV